MAYIQLFYLSALSLQMLEHILALQKSSEMVFKHSHYHSMLECQSIKHLHFFKSHINWCQPKIIRLSERSPL